MSKADVAPAVEPDPDAATKPLAPSSRMTGSLARRMIAIAALWISVLLIGGGLALDQVLKSAITRNFDSGLEYVLIAMIRSSEIGRSEEHTSELQSLMRISYAVFCLKKKKIIKT